MLRRSLPISASCSLRTGGFPRCDTSNSSSARISPTYTLNSGRSFAPPFLLMFMVLILLALVVLPVAIAEACLALPLCKQHRQYTHAAPTALKVHLGGFVRTDLPTIRPFPTSCCLLFSCPGLVFLQIACPRNNIPIGVTLALADHLMNVGFRGDRLLYYSLIFIYRPHWV